MLIVSFYLHTNKGGMKMLNAAENINYKQIYSTQFNLQEMTKISRVLQFMFNKNEGTGFIKFRCNNKIRNLQVSDISSTYKIGQLLNSFETKSDIFISKNLFRTPTSMEEDNIQAITMLVVDVDYKTIKDYRQCTPEQIFNLLELECFNKDIPIPNLIEYSNQIRLIYVLEERIGATTKSKALIKKIENTWAGRLKWIGADDKNALTNGVRLASSYNTKVKKIERINYDEYDYREFTSIDKATVKYFNAEHAKRSKNFIYSNYKYSLEELSKEWLDLNKEEYIKLKEDKATKETNVKNVESLSSSTVEEQKQIKEIDKDKEKKIKTNRHNNISYIFANGLTPEQSKNYSLQICRIQDLETIQRYYDYNMPGYQEYMTFLYRNFCILADMPEEEAEEKALEFYDTFIQHDNNTNRMESKTRNVERKQYRYRNETIIKLLDISEQDEINMQLKTIISIKEKRRRQKIANTRQNVIRKEQRQEDKEKRSKEFIKKIQVLKNKGYTQEQVSKELNKSISTIKRWWNK